VRLEEAGGEQERQGRWIGEPLRGLFDDVIAVRVRDVELVEAKARRMRGFVLHTE
jgi:hypothetical protein